MFFHQQSATENLISPPYAGGEEKSNLMKRIMSCDAWRSKSDISDSLRKLRNEMIERETEYFESQTTYTVEGETDVANQKSIDLTALGNELTTQFYNPSFMKKLLAFGRSLFIHNPDRSFDTFRLRKWFERSHVLKNKGNTSVVQAGFLTEDDFFVVKNLGRNAIDTHKETIHEFFVGSACLNNLRDKVINFAFILGGFKCGVPDKPGKVCTDNDSGVYIIYEKIPGTNANMSMTIANMDLNLYLCTMIQLLLAFDYAHQVYEFTHYDLHTNNVIIRFLDRQYSVPYPSRKGTKYINTNFIPTIIDYGMSYVKKDGKSYGVTHLATYDIVPKSYPAYDIFKVLLMSLFEMPIYAKCDARQHSVKRFIHDVAINFILGEPGITYEQLDAFFHSYSKSFFILPRTKEREEMKYSDILDYILSRYPCNFITDTPVSFVLSCDSGNCKPCNSLTLCVDKSTQLGIYPEDPYDAANYVTTRDDLPVSLFPKYLERIKRELGLLYQEIAVVSRNDLIEISELIADITTYEQVLRTLSAWAKSDAYDDEIHRIQNSLGLLHGMKEKLKKK